MLFPLTVTYTCNNIVQYMTLSGWHVRQHSTYPVNSPKSCDAYAIGLSKTVGLVMQNDLFNVSTLLFVMYCWHSLAAIISATIATTLLGNWKLQSSRIRELISRVTTAFNIDLKVSLKFLKSLNELCNKSNSIFFFTLVFLATNRLHSLLRKRDRKSVV